MSDQRKNAEAKRLQRLEAALRSNLQRRKAQTRGRQTTDQVLDQMADRVADPTSEAVKSDAPPPHDGEKA